KGEVTITVEPLRFAIVDVAPNDRQLVALRTVSTPAGELVQGIVVSLAAAWDPLDPRDGTVLSSDVDGGFVGDGALALSLRRGAVRIVVPPASDAEIAARKNEIARAFLVRFVPM